MTRRSSQRRWTGAGRMLVPLVSLAIVPPFGSAALAQEPAPATVAEPAASRFREEPHPDRTRPLSDFEEIRP